MISPSVSYLYDNLPNAKGRLTKVSSSVSTTEYTAFDILGRVLAAKQTTEGGDAAGYSTGYTYNLSGALIEETYPSGRKVKNVLDNDGELSMVQSARCGVVNGVTATCGDPQGYFSYAKSFTYNAAGAVTSMQLGNGRWESTQFNSRLQPTQIALGTVQNATDKLKLDYSYGTTANNGNVLTQTITVPTVGQTSGFVATQNYSYDSLNRITQATETVGGSQSWNQQFGYDRYGNRTSFSQTLGGVTTNTTPSVDAATNRFSAGPGFSYDASGNLVQDTDPLTGHVRSFAFDGENKQREVKDVTNSNHLVGTYFYDGDGRRVKKVTDTETTIFVYDAGSKLIGEYSTVTPPNTPKVAYLTNDHLGSPRITTDALGQVISRRDFMPYGEEIFRANYGSDPVRQKFTGYERDPETSLDFAQARMYSYRLGRFISEDSFPADIFTPQTWSRYQYCLNNPLHFIDSLGRYDEDVHRDLVAALAYVVGFSESQGNTIANADQWLDDSRSGHTAMPLENGLRDWTGYEGRRDYHFTTEARRLELWGAFEGTAIRGSGDAALEALGTYLHAEQDSYSHEGFDPGLGQVASVGDNLDLRSPIKTVRNRMKEMEKYDKTWNDPEKAVQMARDTLAKLLAARNLLDKTRRVGSLQTSVPWETDKFINEKLRLWAKTTGTTPEDERNKKRNILFEIMQYVTDYRSRQKDDDQKKKL